MTPMRPRLSVSLACLTAVLALSACGTPGSSGDSVSQPSGAVSTGFDTSKKVTLTMWDTENAQGPSKAEDELIQQFEQKYPNVTVKRVVKNFDDYMATIKLAASSSDAPDVFQGNEGAVDRALVKAHLIVPLDGYAKAYGWDTRFGSSAALNPLRWSSDGNQWGVGPAVGHRAEGRGGGSLLQQGHPEPTGSAGTDHVRPVPAEPGRGQVQGRTADHGR